MNPTKLNANIPLLTEVIKGSGSEPSSAPVPILSADEIPTASNKFSQPTASLLNKEQLHHVENELSERVLQQLLTRIDAALEQRLRDSLADALQTTIDRITIDIRNGLRHSLAEVISSVITQEIGRLSDAD